LYFFFFSIINKKKKEKISRVSNKKAARTHENESIEKTKDAREEAGAAISSASSGVVHCVKSIGCAAMDQWQQLITFLAPYIDALTSYPKKFVSKEAIKETYNDLQIKFLDYSFAKFVADVVNIMLTIILLPLTIMIVFWRTVWNRLSYWFTACFGSAMTLTDCVNCLFTTLRDCKDWALGSFQGMANGDLTWQQVWDDLLDNTASMLQKAMTRLGENAYLTKAVRQFGIMTLLQRLHAGPAPMVTSTKID